LLRLDFVETPVNQIETPLYMPKTLLDAIQTRIHFPYSGRQVAKVFDQVAYLGWCWFSAA
jgi:hypothetical protein